MPFSILSESLDVTVTGADGTPTHRLEALWSEGGGAVLDGLVLAPPHPLYGGTIDAPILLALAAAASASDVRALRFNWRGIGASSGRATDDPAAAVEDYRAALAEVARRVPGRIFAGGYSWGAMSAARAAAGEPRVAGLILVAPPALMLDGEALAGLDRDVLVFAGEHDRIAPPRRLAEIVAGAPRSRLVTIAGADHFFAASLGEIQDGAREWLGAQRAKSSSVSGGK